MFNTNELTEKEYIQKVLQIGADSDEKIKQTNAYSDADIEEAAAFLDEELKELDSLEPPESLPQEIIDSHDSLYEGMEQLKTGIRDSGVQTLENGQTIVAMAMMLYGDYIEKNPESTDDDNVNSVKEETSMYEEDNGVNSEEKTRNNKDNESCEEEMEFYEDEPDSEYYNKFDNEKRKVRL